MATLKKTGMRADIDLLLHKPTAPAKLRRRAELAHRGLRWCVQIAFFIAAPAVFSASFNGVKYIFSQMGAQQPLELTAFVSLLVAVLAFTCVFGRFFCGYACAFGTLGDAVHALATPLRRLLHLEGKRMPPALQHALQMLKYAVLAGICALCFAGMWTRVSGHTPWVAFAALDALNIDGVSAYAFAALGAVVVGMAFAERFFCQFLCPMGALFSLLPLLPVSLFRRDRARCAKRCNRCQDRCPVAIHPDRDDLYQGECIACGRCADGCPMANVTLLRVGRALEGDTAAQQRGYRWAVKGNEIVLTLVKAAALAAICYILL